MLILLLLLAIFALANVTVVSIIRYGWTAFGIHTEVSVVVPRWTLWGSSARARPVVVTALNGRVFSVGYGPGYRIVLPDLGSTEPRRYGLYWGAPISVELSQLGCPLLSKSARLVRTFSSPPSVSPARRSEYRIQGGCVFVHSRRLHGGDDYYEVERRGGGIYPNPPLRAGADSAACARESRSCGHR